MRLALILLLLANVSVAHGQSGNLPNYRYRRVLAPTEIRWPGQFDVNNDGEVVFVSHNRFPDGDHIWLHPAVHVWRDGELHEIQKLEGVDFELAFFQPQIHNDGRIAFYNDKDLWLSTDGGATSRRLATQEQHGILSWTDAPRFLFDGSIVFPSNINGRDPTWLRWDDDTDEVSEWIHFSEELGRQVGGATEGSDVVAFWTFKHAPDFQSVLFDYFAGTPGKILQTHQTVDAVNLPVATLGNGDVIYDGKPFLRYVSATGEVHELAHSPPTVIHPDGRGLYSVEEGFPSTPEFPDQTRQLPLFSMFTGTIDEMDSESGLVFDGGQELFGELVRVAPKAISDNGKILFSYNPVEQLPEPVCCNYHPPIEHLMDGVALAIPAIPGDADFDDDVDFLDFLLFAAAFENHQVKRLSDNEIYRVDFDNSYDVDFRDFLVLANNFGTTADSLAAVPEPNSSSLAMFGILPIAALRKRGRR